MPSFDGRLRPNEIFASIYNMIISQQVFADNIAGTFAEISNEAKVDGGLYGDTKLYYAADVLKSVAWRNDAEAANLLALHRPKDPECQKLVITQFRQISLTVDNYLTKRAWADEYAFSSFNSVMLQMIYDTKKIYDATTYNTFIGNDESTIGKQQQKIDLTAAVGAATGQEKNRLEGAAIAEFLGNLLIDLKDATRKFNDYGYMRSYDEGRIKIIWNSAYSNKIKYKDLPTTFHTEEMKGILSRGEVLPSHYFGKVVASNGTTGAQNATICSRVEMDYGAIHVYPGELLPNNTPYKADDVYEIDNTIICKVLVELPPFMSAFEVGTSFFNPKSLTENHYLTWGHNDLEHLKNYPMITLRAKA